MPRRCISATAETFAHFRFARSTRLQQVVFLEIIGSYASVTKHLCGSRVTFAQRRAFRRSRVRAALCTRRIRPIFVLSRRTLHTRATVWTREAWHALAAFDGGARHRRHCPARTNATQCRARHVFVRPGDTLHTRNAVRSRVPHVARAVAK